MARGVVLVLTVVSAAPCGAWHREPAKGKSARTPLVQTYLPCTAPNTTTSGLTPMPACSPPTVADDLCGFAATPSNSASGRVKAKTRNFDVDLIMSARGLAASCEGLTLCGVASVRVTTDRCVVSPCTVADLIDVFQPSETACCVVTDGKCNVRTTINAEIFDGLRAGERAGIEVLSCGLKRVDGPNPPGTTTFSCGLLAP